jgi:hypothetical protein
MSDHKSQELNLSVLIVFLVFGGASGLAVAIANAWPFYVGILTCFLGVSFGGGTWGMVYGRTARPDIQAPQEEVAHDYWRAFAEANKGLGVPSLEADAFARDAKRKQFMQRQAWEQRSVFSNESALTYWSSANCTPHFQPGKRAEAYWAEFDRARLRGLSARAETTRSNTIQTSVPSLESQPNEDRNEHDLPAQHDVPLHLSLIQETQSVYDKIAAKANQNSEPLAQILGNMISSVDLIITELKRDPTTLFEVQRLFTYYLPEVGRILDTRGRMLKGHQNDVVAEIDAILDRVETAFTQFAARIHEADIRALDIDLKLLDQSLAAEFETEIGT